MDNEQKILLSTNSNINNLCDEIKILQQMFIELDELVNSQSEYIDTIEMNINDVKIITEEAEKNIDQSQKYQESTSKVKVVGGILGVIAFYLGIKLL